ncbi:MAG: hypothetical protein IH604_04975 [Burkholderiales bacterium]|nr:hypothetical protein [Burkholderiales bacterium]
MNQEARNDVVGAGNAAMSAAPSAHERGARVPVLEPALQSERVATGHPASC